MTLNQHETKTKSKITRYQIRAASIPLDLNGACPSTRKTFPATKTPTWITFPCFSTSHTKSIHSCCSWIHAGKKSLCCRSSRRGRGHAFVVSMAHRVPTRANPAIKSCFMVFSVSNISFYMVGVILLPFSYTIIRHKIPGGNVDHKLRS